MLSAHNITVAENAYANDTTSKTHHSGYCGHEKMRNKAAEI